MPMHLGMLAVFARAFSSDYDSYISGWSADALFGHSARFNRIASLLANPLLIWCLESTARAVARKDRSRRNIWRARMELLLPAARQLAEEPESLLGLGARAETYAEFDLAEKIFGAEAISRRLEARLDYVTERVALSAPSEDNFIRHLEIFAWIDLLCRDFTTQLRHLGIASNKAVHLPFITGPVVRSAQGIPAGERYIKGMEGKYILKRLLKRRVPSYPIGQRKGSTALVSFPSHYKTGPLSRIWDHYDVPDLIPGELRDRVVSSPLDITYNALTYAVWKRRVLDNEDLASLPTEQRHEWAF